MATIGIGQIDVTSGGQGYDSAPTVTITDTVGTPTRAASATATVAVRGAVTAINVTNPGAGYLTPGLKKFVDTLPGLGPTAAEQPRPVHPGRGPRHHHLPGADYYEIGLVQYRHEVPLADLPATLLRGYVQLSTSVVPGNQVPLSNANLDPALPDTPLYCLTAARPWASITPTTWDRPSSPPRTGRSGSCSATCCRPVIDGNLFLPVDTSLMGAGTGPDMMQLDANGVPMDMALDEGTVLDGVRNPVCGETPKPSRELLHGEPRHPAPARRHHPLDQRRHAAPVDHPGW